MTTEKKYIGNTPLFYEPQQRPRQIITAVAFVAIGLMFGWGYAFAFLGGAAVWSVSLT